MTAARLDLDSNNYLAIEQGADYGPVLFRFRHRSWDEYTVTIVASGTDGDDFSVDVFTANSDRPELAATATYTKQAGDTPANVSAGLQAAILALSVNVEDPDTGALVATSITEFLRVIDGGTSFVIKAISKAVYLGIEADGTVPANISLSHDVDVQVDLSGASALAEIREHQSSSTVLVSWTTADYLSIVLPATRGIMELTKVPGSVTEGYTFELGWWQLDVTTPTETRRWFEGVVENRLSLLLQ